jgi:hypothetical protein
LAFRSENSQYKNKKFSIITCVVLAPGPPWRDPGPPWRDLIGFLRVWAGGYWLVDRGTPMVEVRVGVYLLDEFVLVAGITEIPFVRIRIRVRKWGLEWGFI